MSREGDSDKTQRLRDDIGDLEADIRERERQLEERDEKLESLQRQVQALQEDNANVDHMQQDIDDMENHINFAQACEVAQAESKQSPQLTGFVPEVKADDQGSNRPMKRARTE